MKLTGGPLAGKVINFAYESGSLEFCLHGQSGRYNRAGTWEPSRGPSQAIALGYPVQVEPPTVLNGGDRTTSGAIGQP